jgi:hypothetical protein
MGRQRMNRREILRGTGVALSLPWLESMAPRHAVASAPIKRYIGMYFPNGTARYWLSTGTGASYTMSPILQALAPNRTRALVLGNVGNYSPFGGHIEPSHGHNSASAWTGVKASGPGSNYNAISVDQVIANHMVSANLNRLATPLHSLQVGLSTMNSSPDGIPGQHSRSMSWKSAKEPLYKVVSPQAVFDRIVAGGLPTPNGGKLDPLAERRRALRKSTLDFVKESATRLEHKLGASDRERMDEFMSSVRTLETRVAHSSMPRPTLATCAAIPRPTWTAGVHDKPAGYNRGVHASLMIDLVVMALRCDVTRVVSFMLDDARSDFLYNFLTERVFTETGSTPGTAPVGAYHALQHADPRNNGFATIGYWNVERLNELTSKLAAIDDGNGNLMDSTVITFLSGMNGGNHDARDLPIVVVGTGGGTLRSGQLIRFPAEGRNLADLHLTIMQKVYGVPVKTFGKPMREYTHGNIIGEILA